jgi:hypothetical protein
MGDARQQALRRVESVLTQLQTLGEPGAKWREENGGWTTKAREVWLRCFSEVRDRVLAGDARFEHLAHHLVRETRSTGASSAGPSGRKLLSFRGISGRSGGRRRDGSQECSPPSDALA